MPEGGGTLTRLDVKQAKLSPSPQTAGGLPSKAAMSDCRRQWNREDELPVYLAGPIPTGPNQRKSFGMFSSVEGAFESKTIDFDNYAVGRKGSRTPRSGSRERLLDTGDLPGKTPGEARDGSQTNSPGGSDDAQTGVGVRFPSDKESPNGKVTRRVYALAPGLYLTARLTVNRLKTSRLKILFYWMTATSKCVLIFSE